MIIFYKYYIVVAATNSIVHEVLKESNLSVAIAVPLALLVIIVVLVFTLTVRYNTYYNMWYHVNVVQRLKSALYNKGLYHLLTYILFNFKEVLGCLKNSLIMILSIDLIALLTYIFSINLFLTQIISGGKKTKLS